MNRHYSSAQGLFTQVDPLELDAASLSNPQTLNLYVYCGNDPINNLDPDGLSFLGAIGSFFKAIGKAILSIFTSVSGSSSGPDFRTPPTFPGSLPGINAAIISGIGGFRTPPFVGGLNGFLAQQPGGQKQAWWDWYVEQWKKLVGIDEASIEARRKARIRLKVAAIQAHGRLCGILQDCEFLDKLSDQQVIDLYEAVEEGKESITLDDGHTIQIVAPGQPGNPAPTPKVTPIPPSEVKAAAERLGYDRVVKDPPFKAHGQKVYTNGKDYITRDVDAHIGGVWKKFNKAGMRVGTYDANLNYIGK